MKFAHTIAAACFLAVVSVTTASHAAPPESFAPVVEPLMPAVVNISTTQKITARAQQMSPMFDFDNMPDTPQNRQLKRFFEQFGGMQQGMGGSAAPSKEVTSLGSGFVIDPAGYVVTNNHVVGDADEIRVIFQDNTHYPATIIGRDPKTDLVLLKIKTEKEKQFPYVNFGDSDTLRVGDWVIAVGNPFGLGGSVSAGIISARGRNINAGPFDDFIQTDAAINRGNSGGPLFNARGEVVGINSAIFSPTGTNIGIGFAIPSTMAKTVIGQLKQFGVIHRGWLGVKIQAVSDEIADSLGLGKARGALVLEIGKDSPAVGSGLVVGDVITKFEGREIDEMRKLPRYVADTKPGTKVNLTVLRKGKEATISTKIGELPDDADNEKPAATTKPAKKNETATPQVLGMQLVPLTPQIRAQLGLKSDIKGLVVDDVDMTGEGAKRGLRPGDVIIDANQQPAENVEVVRNALKDAKKAGREFALLRVARGKDMLFVTVSVK